jgi:lysophospholipase L1-like esterase
VNWLLAALAAVTAMLTPAACSDATGPAPEALVLGDSLTVGALEYGDLADLTADAGLAVAVDAESGRPTTGGTDAVEPLPAVPPVVLVALGSNPGPDAGAFPREASRLIAELRSRGARQIVWVPPVAADPSAYATHRAALDDLAGGDASLRILDWDDAVLANPRWLQGDGLHLTEAGYRRLAERMTAAIAEAHGRLQR